jgi:hypothetical protein
MTSNKPSPIRHYVLSLEGTDYIVEAYSRQKAIVYLAKSRIECRVATHKDMLEAGRRGEDILVATRSDEVDGE